VPKITAHIEEVKKWVNEVLAKVGEQLQQETQKLLEVREAIAIEEKKLKDVHGMSAEANTLADILRAQEEARRENEREESEYDHERDIKRNSEETKYEIEQTEKRAQLDAELKRREKLLAEEEERKKIIAEEGQKASAIRALEAAHHEGGGKVLELKIAFLENQAADQKHEIESLRRQLEQAIEKNQSLAAKVIEGASGIKALKFMEEEREKSG